MSPRSATFPGMLQRLQNRGQLEVLEALQAEGHAGVELERRFIVAYQQAVFESSIVAH